MTERYIKRIKKGKGRKKKRLIKDIKELRDEVRRNVRPVISMAMSLMIMEDLKKKEEKDE